MTHRHIFRMTYYKNVQKFIADRAVFANKHMPRQQCYRTSYLEIVNKRGTAFQTPDGDSLNDYVPFYFAPITAMAYTIHMGNVELESPLGAQLGKATLGDLVFLVSNTARFAGGANPFWFSDRACNSLARLPKYENDLAKLATHIEWALFDDVPRVAEIPEIGYRGVCRWYHDRDFPPEHQSRSQKRMAEFLVKDAFPLELVDCIVTKRDDIKRAIDEWMRAANLSVQVLVNPGCYF